MYLLNWFINIIVWTNTSVIVLLLTTFHHCWLNCFCHVFVPTLLKIKINWVESNRGENVRLHNASIFCPNDDTNPIITGLNRYTPTNYTALSTSYRVTKIPLICFFMDEWTFNIDAINPLLCYQTGFESMVHQVFWEFSRTDESLHTVTLTPRHI